MNRRSFLAGIAALPVAGVAAIPSQKAQSTPANQPAIPTNFVGFQQAPGVTGGSTIGIPVVCQECLDSNVTHAMASSLSALRAFDVMPLCDACANKIRTECPKLIVLRIGDTTPLLLPGETITITGFNLYEEADGFAHGGSEVAPVRFAYE